MDDRTLLRVDALLKHIDQIFDDTANISIDELETSNLLLRVVCFSMAQLWKELVLWKCLKLNLKEKYTTKWLSGKKKRAPNYALFLRGPRRVGKSTLANRLGLDNKSYIEIRFDKAPKEIKDLLVNSLRHRMGILGCSTAEMKMSLVWFWLKLSFRYSFIYWSFQ